MSSILTDINDLHEEEKRLDKFNNSNANEEGVPTSGSFLVESFSNKGYLLLQNYDKLLSEFKMRLDVFHSNDDYYKIFNFKICEWEETITSGENGKYYQNMHHNVFLALKEVKELLFTNNNNSDLVIKKIKRDFDKLQIGYDLYEKKIKENGFSDKLYLGKLDNDKHFLNYFFEQFKEMSGLSDNHFELNEECKTEKIEKIKWLGSPEQFGYIFGQLAKKGYIELPTSQGEGSLSKLADLCLLYFEILSTKGKNTGQQTTKENLERAINYETNQLGLKGKSSLEIPYLKDLK